MATSACLNALSREMQIKISPDLHFDSEAETDSGSNIIRRPAIRAISTSSSLSTPSPNTLRRHPQPEDARDTPGTLSGTPPGHLKAHSGSSGHRINYFGRTL
eukprot:1304710-Amorphochlora_amoeboformis.AAC.1